METISSKYADLYLRTTPLEGLSKELCEMFQNSSSIEDLGVIASDPGVIHSSEEYSELFKTSKMKVFACQTLR